MKLLIISATEREISPLLKEIKADKKGNFIFSSKYKNLDLDIVITGVGMAATAYFMGKQLAKKQYDFCLNLGIAGCFNKNIKLGEVFNITEDCIADLGAEDGERFLNMQEINLLKLNPFIPNENIWIKNQTKIENLILSKIKKVKGITVNMVHGNNKSIEQVKKLFNPITESMEGAAFLQICSLENISCAQIRSISNYVEERNLAKWNINLAIQRLNEIAIEILNAF